MKPVALCIYQITVLAPFNIVLPTYLLDSILNKNICSRITQTNNKLKLSDRGHRVAILYRCIIYYYNL